MSPIGRRRMVRHYGISGVTQSGKSTLVRMLLEQTPRWVNLDRRGDYTDGTVTTSFREASVVLRDRARDDSLQLTLQADDPAHHMALVSHMRNMWTGLQLPPVVLVMDEAGDWSSGLVGKRKQLPEDLAWVYTGGLKYGITALTVVQRDQQLATEARDMLGGRIAFRHLGTMTEAMRTAFSGREDELAELETLTPGTTPEKGVHYLTYPPEMRVFKSWRKEVANKMK